MTLLVHLTHYSKTRCFVNIFYLLAYSSFSVNIFSRLINFILEEPVKVVYFSIQFKLFLNICMQKLFLKDLHLLHCLLSLGFWFNVQHFSCLIASFLFNVFMINQVIIVINNMTHLVNILVRIIRVFRCTAFLLSSLSISLYIFNFLFYLFYFLTFVKGRCNFTQLYICNDWIIIILFSFLYDLVHRLYFVSEFAI